MLENRGNQMNIIVKNQDGLEVTICVPDQHVHLSTTLKAMHLALIAQGFDYVTNVAAEKKNGDYCFGSTE